MNYTAGSLGGDERYMDGGVGHIFADELNALGFQFYADGLLPHFERILGR